jgi:hypothetical protein
MVRQLTRRLLRGGALAAVSILAAALPLTGPSIAGLSVAGAAAAHAAGPSAISISGPGLAQPLTVRAGDAPERFAALLGEVNWLASRPGQNRAPEADKLGARYVVTVFTGQKATHRYELYPLAAGGPRVYRPASQPDRHRTTAAWFYGRLTMPDTLRNAGAPLTGTVPSVATGGIGGGEVADKPFDPNSDLTALLTEWRQFLLLNGAVVVIIAAGLAGVSLLVRRRVDRLYRRAAEQGRAPARGAAGQGRAPARGAAEQGRAPARGATGQGRAPVRRR